MSFLDAFEDLRDPDEHARSEPKCNRCGSTDVRWRHNGGKWTLFATQPGVLHTCPIDADDSDEVPA